MEKFAGKTLKLNPTFVENVIQSIRSDATSLRENMYLQIIDDIRLAGKDEIWQGAGREQFIIGTGNLLRTEMRELIVNLEDLASIQEVGKNEVQKKDDELIQQSNDLRDAFAKI